MQIVISANHTMTSECRLLNTFTIILLIVLTTSLQSSSATADDAIKEPSPAGRRLGQSADRYSRPTERSSRAQGALTRLAETLTTLRHMAADMPFEGYSAKRRQNVEELLRYLNGRGRSKLLALLDAAADLDDRSKTSKHTDNDDEVRVSYERRLIEEVLGHDATTDGRRRRESAVSDEDRRELYARKNSTPEEDWLVCRTRYSAFVEPITNSLWNTVRQAICDGVPPSICSLIEKKLEKDMPPWGRRMIDAMSKIPTGLSDGKLTWNGAYDMCESYEVNDTNGDLFNGRYCRLDIAVLPEVNLQFGVCVPDTCDSNDVLRYIKEDNDFLRVLLRVLQWDVTFAYCGHEVDPDNDVSYQVTVAVIIISLVCVVLATIYDGCFRKIVLRRNVKKKQETVDAMKADDASKPASRRDVKSVKRIGIVHRVELLFVAFSAYSNCRRIFTTRTKPGHLSAIDGVRCLSYGYIIWGQTYVWGPIYTETLLAGNLLAAVLTLPESLSFQPILNFHLAADSFLLISGILVTYGFLRRSDNIRGLRAVLKSSLYFIARRYWRLMPALMLAIMAICTTYKYTAVGPFYPAVDYDSENCKVNWWVNLLMLNNLVKVHEQCFGHAWFVSLAFQLYIASLVVVIPLLLRPKLGYVSLVLMYVAHIVCTAVLTSAYREDFEFDAWYNGYFITPWCRAGPFIIGLAFGILLYAKPEGIKLKAPVILLLWLLSFGSIVTVTCVSYDQFRENGERWSSSSLVAFDTLSRSVWALAVGWIVIATQWGYAGVVRDLLTWGLFLPMSRLVYVAMIWHAPIMFGYVYVLRQPLYITTYVMMYAALAHIFFVLVIGLVMALLWDYPLGIRWQKVVLCRTWFEWIRSGRHKRGRIDQMEKDLEFAANRQTRSSDTALSSNDAIDVEGCEKL